VLCPKFDAFLAVILSADEAGRPGEKLAEGDFLHLLQSHPEIAAVSSHTLWSPLPKAENIHFREVLFLREPLDRLRSMYDFYGRSPVSPHPLTRKAKELDLQSFLKYLISSHPHLVQNPQLRALATSGARVPVRCDLDNAAMLVRRAAVVGTVELYDKTLATGERHLRKIFPSLDLSNIPKNVSQGRANDLQLRLKQFEAECGTDLCAELKALNKLDSELVAMAADEATRRFLELPVPNAVLRSFQKRVQQRVRRRIRIQRYHQICERARDFLRRRKRQLIGTPFRRWSQSQFPD
jgi:hypothetical protein